MCSLIVHTRALQGTFIIRHATVLVIVRTTPLSTHLYGVSYCLGVSLDNWHCWITLFIWIKSRRNWQKQKILRSNSSNCSNLDLSWYWRADHDHQRSPKSKFLPITGQSLLAPASKGSHQSGRSSVVTTQPGCLTGNYCHLIASSLIERL